MTLAVPEVLIETAFVLISVPRRLLTLSILESVLPIALVMSTKGICHLPEASDFALIKLAFVHVTVTKCHLAIGRSQVRVPLSFKLDAVFIGHSTHAMLLVLIEEALVCVSVQIELFSVALFLVHDHLALIDLPLLCNRFCISVLSAISPDPGVHLARVENLEAELVELACLELAMAECAVFEDKQSLSLRLHLLVDLSCVLGTFLEFFILQESLVSVYLLVDLAVADFLLKLVFLLRLSDPVCQHRFFFLEVSFDVHFSRVPNSKVTLNRHNRTKFLPFLSSESSPLLDRSPNFLQHPTRSLLFLAPDHLLQILNGGVFAQSDLDDH